MQDFTTLPKVTVTRDTSVPAAAIWKVLSDLPALADWAPATSGKRSRTERPSPAIRRQEKRFLSAVTTAQFGVIVHEVTHWVENQHFAYVTADSGPFSRTFTSYEVSEDAVSVTLSFEVKPGAMEVEQAQAVLNKGLTATLQALELRARMAMA